MMNRELNDRPRNLEQLVPALSMARTKTLKITDPPKWMRPLQKLLDEMLGPWRGVLLSSRPYAAAAPPTWGEEDDARLIWHIPLVLSTPSNPPTLRTLMYYAGFGVKRLSKLEIICNMASEAVLTADSLANYPSLKHYLVEELGFNDRPVGILDHKVFLMLHEMKAMQALFQEDRKLRAFVEQYDKLEGQRWSIDLDDLEED